MLKEEHIEVELLLISTRSENSIIKKNKIKEKAFPLYLFAVTLCQCLTQLVLICPPARLLFLTEVSQLSPSAPGWFLSIRKSLTNAPLTLTLNYSNETAALSKWLPQSMFFSNLAKKRKKRMGWWCMSTDASETKFNIAGASLDVKKKERKKN